MNIEELNSKKHIYLDFLYKKSRGRSEQHLFKQVSLGRELGLDKDETDLICDRLENEGLIKTVASGPRIVITHLGIQEIEKPNRPVYKLPTPTLNNYDDTEELNKKRFRYLEFLYQKTREEPFALLNGYKIGKEAGLEGCDIEPIYVYLNDEGFLKTVTIEPDVEITHEGKKEVEAGGPRLLGKALPEKSFPKAIRSILFLAADPTDESRLRLGE